MNYTFIPKAILVLWGLTYFWRIFSPFTKKLNYTFNAKAVLMLWGLTYFSCQPLFVYFCDDILLTAWFLLIWLVNFFGAFLCKQLIFSCLLLVADYCFDILWFSFSIYFLLVKIFYQFSLFEKGEFPFPILSVFVFWKSTVLLLVIYPL